MLSLIRRITVPQPRVVGIGNLAACRVFSSVVCHTGRINQGFGCARPS